MTLLAQTASRIVYLIRSRPFGAVGIVGAVALLAGGQLLGIPESVVRVGTRAMLAPLLIQFRIDVRKYGKSHPAARFFSDPQFVFWTALVIAFVVVFLLAGETRKSE